MAERQFVIFKIDDQNFGVDINLVNEIIQAVEIYRIPEVPDFVEGMINLRGKVITVINLRKKFRMPPCDLNNNNKIIIVNTASMTVGFIVEEVSEIRWVDEKDIDNTPELFTDLNRRYLGGVAKIGGMPVLLIDLKQILTGREEDQLTGIGDDVSLPASRDAGT